MTEFECPVCGNTRLNATDLANEYCPRCHLFVGDLAAFVASVGGLGAYWDRINAVVDAEVTPEVVEERLRAFMAKRRGRGE